MYACVCALSSKLYTNVEVHDVSECECEYMSVLACAAAQK